MANIFFCSFFVIALATFPGFNSDQISSFNNQKTLICQHFQCADQNMVFQNNQCLFKDPSKNTNFLKACDPQSKTPYCPSSFLPKSNLTCEASPQQKIHSYPGGLCKINQDCVKGTCIGKTCEGQKKHQQCEVHQDCNPGLRCIQNQCLEQVKDYQQGCFSDYDCLNHSGCNRTNIKESGTCIPYFSVGTGGIVSNCDKFYNVSTLCVAGSCSRYQNGLYQCTESVVSKKPLPSVCSGDSECLADDESVQMRAECSCGLSETGSSYCKPFIGDPPGVSYRLALMEFISVGYLEGCNTVMRQSQDCWKLRNTTDEYSNLVTTLYRFIYYPQLV